MSVLLDYGADVNLRDGNNQRPTELAPAGGKTQQLLKTFEGTAWCVEKVEIQAELYHSNYRKSLSPSLFSFSQESLPAVSYPDQESDW